MIFSLYEIFLLIIIIAFSTASSIQDIKHMKVSDYILWTASVAALVCNIIFTKEHFWISLLTAAGTGLLYFIVRLITKKKLGMADVYFGIFQGMCLPYIFIPACILLETIVSFLVNRKRKDKPFPFIPFMSASLVIIFIVSACI